MQESASALPAIYIFSVNLFTLTPPPRDIWKCWESNQCMFVLPCWPKRELMIWYYLWFSSTCISGTKTLTHYAQIHYLSLTMLLYDTQQLLRDERGIKRSFCQPHHKHKNSPITEHRPSLEGNRESCVSPRQNVLRFTCSQEAVMLMWRSFLYLMICFCRAKRAKLLPPFFFSYLKVKQGGFGNIPPVAEDYQRYCKWYNRRITPLPCPGSSVCSSFIISSVFSSRTASSTSSLYLQCSCPCFHVSP